MHKRLTTRAKYKTSRITVLKQRVLGMVEYFAVLDTDPESKISLSDRIRQAYQAYQQASDNRAQAEINVETKDQTKAQRTKHNQHDDHRVYLLVHCLWEPRRVIPAVVHNRFTKLTSNENKDANQCTFVEKQLDVLRSKFTLTNYGRELDER